MPYLVGLTGGIGSGKTTVANLFVELGAGIIDSDEVARALTAPGGAAIAEIGEHFGAEYVTAEGALDRSRMRKLVFGNEKARRELEGILHPRIRLESQRLIAKTTAPYVIVVVPLLLESRAYRGLANRVLVVDCAPETQVTRVMRRSGLSREEVLAIMATQLRRDERLRNADDIVDNEGDPSALRPQIPPLHQQFLKFASKE